jgi:lysophospholipase L1-like esterase
MAYKEEMFSLFHEKMPDAIFIVMSGLLLPGRSEYTELTQEVNRQLALLCEETDYMVFVDATVMTYTNGAFRSALFVEDGIHLNDAGRAAWADDYIRPAIEAVSARE